MKKTLVALAVTAFAASASAVTVYDAEGSKVEVDGSLRLILAKEQVKTTDVATGKSAKADKSNLRNAGSRFGVRAQHQLGEDFYALGRLEFRFNKTQSNDGFGDVYAHRAYVGFGSKAAGEVTFGRQVTIIDDMSQTNDYEWGLVSKGEYGVTAGTQVVRYDYKGVEGLQVGVGYNFNQTHSENGTALVAPLKNAYHAGAIYARDAYDFRLGYSHASYETGSSAKHRQDGYLASASYAFGDFKVIGDFGYAHIKNDGVKTNKFYVAPGFQYQVVPASKVYGNYFYERVKTTDVSKEKTHGFLLGADYKFHKHVVAFVEGKYTRTKGYDKAGSGYDYTTKVADKAIGVGMRVFW